VARAAWLDAGDGGNRDNDNDDAEPAKPGHAGSIHARAAADCAERVTLELEEAATRQRCRQFAEARPVIRSYQDTTPSEQTSGYARNRRSPFSVTMTVAPVSATTASHNGAAPKTAKIRKANFVARAIVTFCLITFSARLEWLTRN
jgi:hypothetical protein